MDKEIVIDIKENLLIKVWDKLIHGLAVAVLYSNAIVQ